MSHKTLLVLVILNLSVGAFLLHRFDQNDYMGFYANGKAAVAHPEGIFNESVQREFQRGLAPRYLPFLHLPHELLIFIPLSSLPFAISAVVWRLLCVGLLVYSCVALARVVSVSYKEIILFAGALLPTTLCLVQGQDSLLLVALMVASLASLQKDRPALAGFFLALSLFKPQVSLVIALAMFVNRRWRFVFGFASTSVAIAIASLAIFGRSVFADLVHLIMRSQSPSLQESMLVKPQHYPTLRGFAFLLTPPGLVLGLVLSFLVVLVFLPRWWSATDTRYPFVSAVVVGTLAAFNWHNYDLVVLLVPIAAMYDYDRLSSTGVRLLLFSPVLLALAYFNLLPLLCLPMLMLAMSCYRGDLAFAG